jgi:DNA-directed RNA polymerase specialized sigma24 family protein
LVKRSSIDEVERELITALYPSLRKMAAVAGSVDVEPDDLVQEALMRTLRKGPISDLDNPLAFLRKTIVNLASNQRRSLGRKRKALGRLSLEESKWPS